MTAVAYTTLPPASREVIRARPAGFLHDLAAISGRALRAVPRDPAAVIPPVFIALFFFVVNIATLKKLTGNHPGFNYTSFEMATAILLGVTGISRAPALVLDVQTHYLDRLLLTPVRRTAILIGHMTADVTVSAVLTAPILILGVILGVRFPTGPLGIAAFVLMASLWSLAFAGFNPVTYLLQGLRSLVLGNGWQWLQLAQAAAAIAVVGLISMTLCFAALRGRVKRNSQA